MTDERQVRSLLTLAAELPDDLQPAVGPLLRRARRMRRARAISSVLAVVAVTAAAFTLPSVVRGLSHGSPEPVGMGGSSMRGPTVAQLTHFHWSSLPSSPYSPGSDPLLASTGRELLVIHTPTGRGRLSSAYDFATHAWRTIARPPTTVGLAGAVSVWTGHELFVTNGKFGRFRVPHSEAPDAAFGPLAGLYDPATDRWTTTPLPGQMLGVSQLAAAWTGRVVVLAAVSLRHHSLTIATYDPRTGHWQVITPALPARHPPVGVAMVATQDHLVLWSLWSLTTKVSANGYAVASGVDVLSLGRDGRWSTITRDWPQHKTVDNPVYAADRILVPPGQIWCGLCSHPPGYFPAQLADARTLTRAAIPSGPLVIHRLEQPPIWLWNGRSVLAADTQSHVTGDLPHVWITRMAAFDPATNRWSALPAPPGKPSMAANPIWAGRQLLLLTAGGGLLSFHS
jgi:hypothetical protein